MSESVEIVASFPFPPKQFYENLTEEEILQMAPPPLPTSETLLIFGNEQSLKIIDKEQLMVTEDLISELNGATDEIFENFKSLAEGIEMVQDTSKVSELIKSIREPFEKAFTITSKLSTIQAAVSLKNCIEKDFEEIDAFLNE